MEFCRKASPKANQQNLINTDWFSDSPLVLETPKVQTSFKPPRFYPTDSKYHWKDCEMAVIERRPWRKQTLLFPVLENDKIPTKISQKRGKGRAAIFVFEKISRLCLLCERPHKNACKWLLVTFSRFCESRCPRQFAYSSLNLSTSLHLHRRIDPG